MAVKINKATQESPASQGAAPPVADSEASPTNPETPTVAEPSVPKEKKPKAPMKRLTKSIGVKGKPNKKKFKPPVNVGLKRMEKLFDDVEKNHAKTDEELMAEFAADPDAAEKKTHRLTKEQMDMRLVLMHRLVIRKVSPKDIRAQIGVSEPMYYYLRKQLDSMMRLDVSKLDVPYMIGDSLALYDEVRSMALVMCSSQAISDPRIKLAAMTVALRAEQDKNAFLTSCGVYAPAIVDQLVHGMIAHGRTLMLSGQQASTRTVEEMTSDLLSALASELPVQSIAQFDVVADVGNQSTSDENSVRP